ncbi:type IV pilus modification protein PilV [Acinetobacter indicus]|uniref:type IV pilus modification protein PilV n=2 Tax=Moraxellaceae TaxID=468 RepID=UPI0015D4455F
MNSSLSKHRGVGLMEVLISLVVLSIAILGFVALQIRATVATEEAIKRSDALIIVNGMAEKMRLNPLGNYSVDIPATSPTCVSTQDCNADNQALADLYFYNQVAIDKGISLAITGCPNTSSQQSRMCILSAWNDTLPTIAADDDQDHACMASDGKYISGNDCLVLEAY